MRTQQGGTAAERAGSGVGLIRRKRQGLGRPDRIYVMNFVSAQSSPNGSSDSPKALEPPETEIQLSENGNSDTETSCFETSVSPENSTAGIPKGEPNKTDPKQKTSLDKGTQRKTTENELPSLTQCTA